MQSQGYGQLPSQPTPNPKGNVSALTLRSGKTTSDPIQNSHSGLQQNSPLTVADSTSQKFQNFPTNPGQTDSAQNGMTGTDHQHFIHPAASELTQSGGTDFGLEINPIEASNSASNSAQNLDKNFNQQGVEPSIPLPFPRIRDCIFEDAMLDLGASINVMPKSVFQSLRIGPLQPTGVVIQLANRSQAHPAGVIEDVLVKVRELIFSVDFYILDMEGDVLANMSPLILGRPFLKTARTKIDVHAGTLSMEIGDTVVRFSIFEAMKHPREDHSILSMEISEELEGMDFLSEIDSDLDTTDVDQGDELFHC
ncbi:uncharacterized protein LOC121978597 [Zingiber officinale]|uniref:uncharacterized protein LOC121978597 n=1 Tax=Zingiber officinale TaxID=94328 RepID=UPI001C4DA101|nr:uncharacterized protein LOC121978597 [Zingiber officinale]